MFYSTPQNFNFKYKDKRDWNGPLETMLLLEDSDVNVIVITGDNTIALSWGIEGTVIPFY